MNKTITNRIQTLGVASVMVLALMVGMMFPQGAHAQSQEDLMQMINNLLAQVAMLQAQLGNQTGSSTAGFHQGIGFSDEFFVIEAGRSDQPIAELLIEASDETRYLNRLEVVLEGDVSVYRAFDQISIWVDGMQIYEENIGDMRWDLTASNQYTATIYDAADTGYGLRLPANQELEAVIAVSVEDGVSAGDWTFAIADEGVDTWSASTGDVSIGDQDLHAAAFGFEIDGKGDILKVSSSSNDPDAATLQLERDDESDEYTIFVFELEAGDNDIEINTLPVIIDFAYSALRTDDVFADVTLVIDGQEFNDYSSTQFDRGSDRITFDIDGDVVVEAGESVEVELVAQFEPLAVENEGRTITASVAAIYIKAEGSDDLGYAQLQGEVTGETHTLATQGLNVYESDSDASVNGDRTTGTFEIEVEVEAFEGDFYLSQDDMFDFAVLQGRSSEAQGETSISVTTTADEVQNEVYEVQEGETETFTITVNFTPTEDGTFNLELRGIEYGEEVNDTNDFYTPLDEDFSTVSVPLNGSGVSSPNVDAEITEVGGNKRPKVYATIEGADSAGLLITDSKGETAYESNLVDVRNNNGHWVHQAPDNLYNGDYTLALQYDGEILDEADHTVTNGRNKKADYSVYYNENHKRTYDDVTFTTAQNSCSNRAEKWEGEKIVRCEWDGETFFESAPAGAVQGVSTSAGPTLEDQMFNALTELSAYLRATLQ